MAKKKNNDTVEELEDQKNAQETTENDNDTNNETATNKKEEQVEAVEAEELSIEEKLTAENAELKDKFRRLFAEFDNFKKRTAKERIEMFKSAGQDIIVDLLPVLDDFERAIKANEEANGPAEENDGFILIHKKLSVNLDKKGLTKMEAIGNDFDAELHEAIAEIPGDETMKGKIIDVVEDGYHLNNKIIRHAKVVVGK
ncbi:UNVERIFIED_CONTAM: hypothetical protein GTU68_003731 [Idotea baltica]|nr:hypothetical protein [Idotea baltica]